MLPGDKKPDIGEILRVNHAGEYGAKRIYQGQIAATREYSTKELLKDMLTQEEKHLEYFEKEILERKTRPSILIPIWGSLGYALGYITAKISKESAMMCTEAVEEVIDKHYAKQIESLEPYDVESKLKEKIMQFRVEEQEHHDVAVKNNSSDANGYNLLKMCIMTGCKLAIKIAKKF